MPGGESGPSHLRRRNDSASLEVRDKDTQSRVGTVALTEAFVDAQG